MHFNASSSGLGIHRLFPRFRPVSTKEILRNVARKLPPGATLADAIHELEFRQAVQDGLASLDRGERVPLEEARKRLPAWLSKYSSPRKR
jgi:predicted transcriptional regulator